MQFFYYEFPDLAVAETKVIKVKNFMGLPNGEYAFVELYCPDINCDCRRVLLNIISKAQDKHLATINFGWEPVEFYQKNGSISLKEAIKDKGPFLDPLNRQSKYSDSFLILATDLLLSDDAYIDRLKKHYTMFKERKKQTNALTPINAEIKKFEKKIERNSQCICGSGKKYKKCCGLSAN